MSEYVYNTVTSYGAALIAQATAANPIVLIGALSKATAASGVQELATADASWYGGKTGSIATVSATDNVARIVAVFRNSGALQAAKSIAVTARLASQSDSEAVVLAAISDPDSTIELPSSDDTGQAVEFPINIAINPGGTIQTTPGASASVADLDRFVSLHAPGQPTTGEDQTILGDKTLNGAVTFNGSVTGGSATFTTLYCQTANIQTIGALNISGNLITASVVPTTPSTGTIGASNNWFSGGYIIDIYSDKVTSDYILPSQNSAGSVGSSSYRYGIVYTDHLSCNSLFPTLDGTGDVGLSGNRYNYVRAVNVVADYLQGVIPTAYISENSLVVPLGAIICMYIEASMNVIATGSDVTVGSGDSIYTGTLSGRGALLIPEGTYRTLGDCDVSGGPCMVMRIA